jgi:hypothetical protein
MRRLFRYLKELRLKQLRWNGLSSKIPRKWKQITLEQFIQLNDLPETSNKVTNLINKLTVLTKFTEEEIRALKTDDLNKINRRLSFISKLPASKDIDSFFFNGKTWKRGEIKESTVAQITDILQMNQDENNVGAKILNAMSVIFYTDDQKDYDSDRFKRAKEEFLQIDFDTALSSTVFFSLGLTKYFPNVLEDCLKKLTTTELEKLTSETETDFELNEFGRFINGMILSSDLQERTS